MQKAKDNHTVLKASVVYIIVSLINKGIGIITVPIFTRLLTVEEMGTVTTWISWMTMLLPITSLSLASGSMYIAMNEYKGNERQKYQSSVLSLATISSVLCLIVYLIFSDFFNSYLTLSTPLMVFMFAYLMFSPSLEMWLIQQRYVYNVKGMAIVTLVSNISASAFSVLLILLLKHSGLDLGEIRLYSTYTVLLLFGLFFFIYILVNGKVFYSKKYWSFGLKISVPLMVHTLAKNILDVSDRSMISLYCGKGDAGIYGTIYSISALSLVIWSSINNAFVPYLYEKLENNKKEDINEICKITYIIIIVYAAVCIGLTAIAPEIIQILTTDEYFSAVYIIPPIATGIYLTCIYNIFANVILFHKKSVGVMVATVIASIINIVLNAIFIPMFGYVAASYTTLIAFVVLSVFQGIVMKIVHKEKLYDMKLIILITCVVVLICLSFNLVYNSIIIRYSMIIILFVVMFIFRKKLIKIFKKIKSR